MTPSISTTFDLATCEHVLMATSYGRAAEAGPRLFRAPPHPDIKFRHDSLTDAERDADKLRAYFAGLGKGPSKAALRKAGTL